MRNIKDIQVAKSAPDLRVLFDTNETVIVAFGNWEDADLYGVRSQAEQYWTQDAFDAYNAMLAQTADRRAAEQANLGD